MSRGRVFDEAMMRTATVGRFEMWLARTFGKRFLFLDGEVSIEYRRFRGKMYVVGIEHHD